MVMAAVKLLALILCGFLFAAGAFIISDDFDGGDEQ